MCIYSRKIVKQSCDTAKLSEEQKNKVFKHVLTLESQKQEGGHILELVNISRRDVRKMMENGIEFHFDKNHSKPGLELLPITSEILREKDFMAMQKERKILMMNQSTEVVFDDNSLLHGIVVNNVVHVKDLCVWIANNK